MDQALLTVAAGMRSRMETLEVLGNNIANAPTSGYKADREFYRLFATAEARLAISPGDRPWMPVVEGSVIDFAQGPLIQTAGPLDLALSGPGFLVVRSPSGDLYTRSGSEFSVHFPQGQRIDPKPARRGANPRRGASSQLAASRLILTPVSQASGTLTPAIQNSKYPRQDSSQPSSPRF